LTVFPFLKRFVASPALLIFLGVVLLLALANREFFFVTVWHENGDIAVNALQIERAKHLHELYGNYSRFHFNHPGPAFFYAYAVGEILFYDWLHVVSSPHSAHVFAGLLLQAAFFTAALCVAAQWIRSSLFLPLALILGAIHFGWAENTFTSIWPPHALMMPFLCFLISCTSVASGRVRHLPLAALAGCFLVHGYVAQPLFVVTLFLFSYGLCWMRARDPGERFWNFVRHYSRSHIIASATIVVFLLPLLIDLTYGADSNFSRILDFLRGHRGEHQSLWRALIYLLAFFCYLHTQDIALPERGGTNISFLGENLLSFALWACVLAIIAFYVVRVFRANDRTERPFVLSLIAILVVTLGLSLVWGMIQVGPMFEFNGHFYYGTLFAILLLLAAALSEALPSRGKIVLSSLCYIGAATIAWQMTRPPISTTDPGGPVVQATAAALKADPKPTAPKLFVFNHDDWGEVASTALALKRAGYSYRVDGNWAFMFGHYRTFKPEPPDFDVESFSVWRFIRNHPADKAHPIFKGLQVTFEPALLDPAGTVIDCSKNGNLDRFSLFGFASDGEASWTTVPEAGLQFRSPPVTRDVAFSILASPFAPATVGIHHQPMHLYVNGRKVGSYTLSSEASITAKIPSAIWNLRPVVTIVFHLPSAISPAKLGLSGDHRILGWSIRSMSFKHAP
jgi:hypothetical protein